MNEIKNTQKTFRIKVPVRPNHTSWIRFICHESDVFEIACAKANEDLRSKTGVIRLCRENGHPEFLEVYELNGQTGRNLRGGIRFKIKYIYHPGNPGYEYFQDSKKSKS